MPKKNHQKSKKKKYNLIGGTKCSVIPNVENRLILSTGNCNINTPDCFNNPQLPQLGRNPYTDLPTLSEVIFNGRYCCGNDKAGSQSSQQIGGASPNLKDGIIKVGELFSDTKHKNYNQISFFVMNGRFSTEGLDKEKANSLKKILQKKKIKSTVIPYVTGGYKLFFTNQKLHQNISNHKNFLKVGGSVIKMKGGGYYLALDNCPPGGLSNVKGYDDCCPPVFSGKLSGSTESTIWNPLCENAYAVPPIGGYKKTKKKLLQKKKNIN